MLAAAMDGAMTFHTALRKRLDIIKPSRSLLTKTLTLRPPSQHLSPNVRQLVALLHSRKVAVYLVSGVSLPLLAMSESSVTMCPHTQEMIEPVARELGIKMDNVYGNSLRWDENGEYLSGPHSCLPFPPSQPPSLSVAGVWWWRALVSSDVSALMSSLSLSLSLLAVYSCAREHGLMRGHLQDL